MKDEVFKYVKRCDLCQRAKPAQIMARNRVAKRFDVGRKEAQYKVGDTVVCQMRTLSSKGKGVPEAGAKMVKANGDCQIFAVQCCSAGCS